LARAYKQALTLSLVWNSSFIKVNPQKIGGKIRLAPYIVEPHNFGVLNESVPELRNQEAFVHAYRVGKDELRRRVSVLPNGADIMRRVTATPTSHEDAFPESIHKIIVAGPANMTTSTTRGIVNIPELFNQLQYKPNSVEDQVEMYELWVWDDSTDDYRTITCAAPGVVIYGRKDIGNLLGIQAEQPFIHVCPNRLHNYFFGWSEIVGLIRLQVGERAPAPDPQHPGEAGEPAEIVLRLRRPHGREGGGLRHAELVDFRPDAEREGGVSCAGTAERPLAGNPDDPEHVQRRVRPV
jgi:hypothetical protein